MNWLLSVINFVVLIGISIYYAGSQKSDLKIGRLPLFLSGIMVLFPVEYFLLLVWLGDPGSILTIELAMIAGIPVVIYLQKGSKANTASQSLANRLIKQDSNIVNIIYFAAYILIKLVLVLIATVFIVRNVLNWQSLSPLMLIILAVALYTAFGNYKALVITHTLQTILCLITLVLFLFLGDNIVFGALGGANIAVWKLAVVIFFYGLFQLTFEQQYFQNRQSQTVKTDLYLPLFAKVILVVIFTLYFVHIGEINSTALLLLSTDSISHGSNIIIQLGFIALIIGSLASVFHTVANLFVRDFYAHEKEPDISLESELIRKLIITLVAFLSVILVLIVKSAHLGQLAIYFGVWLSFAITSVILVISSSWVTLHKITILVSYGFGIFLHLVRLPFLRELFGKSGIIFPKWLVTLNIFDISLLTGMFVVLMLVINQLFVLCSSNKNISREIKLSK